MIKPSPVKLNGFAGEGLFIEKHIEENKMKYGNNELRERWKAIKRQAWNDDEFNEQVEKFEKYAVEEFQRVQKNANIKLRILEEKYKQDREEIMKGLYADEIEINDSCIEIIDEIYNEIPKESRVKNTTSMRQLLLRIWAEQANCLYISSWNERENGSEMLDCGRVKGKKKNEVGGKAKGGISRKAMLEKSIAKQRERLDKYIDLCADGIITKQELMERRKGLDNQIADLQSQYESVEQEDERSGALDMKLISQKLDEWQRASKNDVDRELIKLCGADYALDK